MNILVIEDHDELRAMLVRDLNTRGYAVAVAATGAQALQALASHTHDAMILDLGLPDMDGMHVLNAARKCHVPCLVLSARDALQSRIDCLNAGADDYVLKPFDLVELEARLRAVLRRANSVDLHRLVRGNVTCEPASRLIQVAGRVLDLPRRESLLLEEMLRVAPRIVVKDCLEERLYPLGESVTLNAIEALVSRLRRRLQAMGASIRIDTVRGVGYRILEQPAHDA